MLKYLQLPFHFDAAKMHQEILHMNTAGWQEHYQKLHYEGEWTALSLRSTTGAAGNIIISPEENATYRDTELLAQSPYLKEVLQTFKCPLMAVRLLKLNAGALIKAHRDADLCYEKGEIRLHIPIITHPDVEFYLENESMQMKEGECWYLNFNLMHQIHNKSAVNRIHLVIDAKVNAWVRSVFESADILIKKEIEDIPTTHDEATTKQMILLLREMNTETSNKLADGLEKELGK
jgi:hypothetical protein